jgi:hypothetical protein
MSTATWALPIESLEMTLLKLTAPGTKLAPEVELLLAMLPVKDKGLTT